MDLGGGDLCRPVCGFRSAGGRRSDAPQACGSDRQALQVQDTTRPLMMSRVAGFRLWLLAFLLLGLCAPAQAAVEIAFYSRELGGNNFPHAFIALHGTVDSTGEQVDTTYGFTAHSVTPAVLFGSVTGEVVVEGERQMAR